MTPVIGSPYAVGVLFRRRMQAMAAFLAILLAGSAHAQGFTSAPITSGTAPWLSTSISLAVSPANGQSYCAYRGERIYYATLPEGGSWTTDTTLVNASKVSLAITAGTVVPHLAFTDWYYLGSPPADGFVLWGTRSTLGVWSYEAVEYGGEPGILDADNPSIALNADQQPVIAYTVLMESGETWLKLATRTQTNTWPIELVAVSGYGFNNVTLRMNGSSPVLAYTRHTSTGQEFVYAYKSGGQWAEEVIEPASVYSRNGAMTMPPNGVAEVAYAKGWDLIYAYRLGANNWVKTKVGPMDATPIDHGISITHDASSFPHIAYYFYADSVGYVSQQSTCAWNFQSVVGTVGGTPLSIGLHHANPNKPKIGFVGTYEAGYQYSLAEGDQAPDITPPATTSDLTIVGMTTSPRTVTLNWTAPGDDGTYGTAKSYSVRKRSGSEITEANWLTSTVVPGVPVPSAPGTTESITVSGLPGSGFWYFALRTTDDACNTSGVSDNDCIKFGTPMGWCGGGGGAAVLAREEGVPARELAIQAVRPNPTSEGGADVSFTLADDSPARLEVLDIAGRRVELHDLARLGPGVHEVRLGARAKLSPGHYWVRIRQGDRSATHTAIVVR